MSYETVDLMIGRHKPSGSRMARAFSGWWQKEKSRDAELEKDRIVALEVAGPGEKECGCPELPRAAPC